MSTETLTFLIHFLKAPELGLQDTNAAHVTLLGHIGERPPGSELSLLDHIDKHTPGPISLGVESREFFGPEGQYEVLTLADGEGKLAALHSSIYDSLLKDGYPVGRREYCGENYRPHMSVFEGMEEPQSVILDSLTLVHSTFDVSTGAFLYGEVIHNHFL